MRVLGLCAYDLRRVWRHRAVCAVMIGLPVAVAVARLIAGPGESARVLSWAGATACGAMALAAACIQHTLDKASGLADGLASSPLGPRGVLAARALAGILVLALQLAILLVVR